MDTEVGSLVELGLALKLGNGEALDLISESGISHCESFAKAPASSSGLLP